jgi:hypothetical protein
MLEGFKKILLINCSKPNYNLAIEKMRVYFGERAIVGISVDDLFVQDCDAVCLSVIFSWDAPFAVMQAKSAQSRGKTVLIGGGGTEKLKHWIEKETGIKPHYMIHPELEAVEGKFKMVYFTRGCIQKCWWCTVPRIEGNTVTLNYKSHPAPVLMDNNLSQIPFHYKEYIVERYLSAGIRTVDCNSGFEPQGIDEETVRLFDQLPLRWWRMGFDSIDEEKPFVEAVKLIQSISKKKIRAFTMIGHEPIEKCRYRCEKVIDLGCEPVPQGYIQLDAKTKTPFIMHDWNERKLSDFQRFFYQPALWRKLRLEDYAPRVDKVKTFLTPTTQTTLKYERE